MPLPLRPLRRRLAQLRFSGSEKYWEERYRRGGTSGAGSAGRLATFKAETVNRIIADHDIDSVVELGCGDGYQAEMIRVAEYVGSDVSTSALALCQERFADDPSRSFVPYGEEPACDMSLSMDVILHLVEDDVFDDYMRRMFEVGRRLVTIYSTDHDNNDAMFPHNMHRRFTRWVTVKASGWTLVEHVPGPWPFDPSRPDTTSDAGFHVYSRRPLYGGPGVPRVSSGS